MSAQMALPTTHLTMGDDMAIIFFHRIPFRTEREREMNKKLAVIILAVCAAGAFGQEAKVRWSFDALADGRTRESVSGKMDALEGYAERAPGVKGAGCAWTASRPA